MASALIGECRQPDPPASLRVNPTQNSAGATSFTRLCTSAGGARPKNVRLAFSTFFENNTPKAGRQSFYFGFNRIANHIFMSVRNVLLLITILFCFAGCEWKDLHRSINSYQYTSDSFLPMAIGNYWKVDFNNYTEIKDTIRIDGALYYEFYSLIGGDAIQREYLRIDSENNLISGSPRLSWSRVEAKFNSSAGDTFVMSSYDGVHHVKVTTISKSDDTIEFEYEPAAAYNKYNLKYKKGLGRISNWKEVRIDGIVYEYD